MRTTLLALWPVDTMMTSGASPDPSRRCGSASRLRSAANLFQVSAVVVTVAGCGARTGLPDPATTSPVADAGSSDGSAADAAADAGPVGRVYRCSFGPSGDDTRPSLVVATDEVLYYVYESGRVRPVWTAPVAPGTHVQQSLLIARGERVAWTPLVIPNFDNPDDASRVEGVVLTASGESVWQASLPFAYEGWGSEGSLHGNENGLFVLSMLEVQAQLGVTVTGTTHTTWAGLYYGVADPDEKGRMVVNRYGNSSADYHWFDTVTGAVTPSDYLTSNPSSALIAGGAIVSVAPAPARFVVERAGGIEAVPIEGFELEPTAYLYALGASDRWVLFGDPTMAYRPGLKLDMESRTATVLSQVSPPTGHIPATPEWNAGIDAAGAVYARFTSEEREQVFRSTDGTNWEPVGWPIAGAVYATLIQQVGGTYLMRSSGDGAPRPPGLPDEVVWGSATHLARPAAGVIMAIERYSEPPGGDNPLYAADVLSPDGRCLAYWRDGSLHSVDVESETVRDLAVLADATSTVAVAWIVVP